MKDVEASQGAQHHHDIALVLSSMGVTHAVNHITSDGFFCADILISGHHVLIQVDDPHHYTCNTGQPIGRTCCCCCYLPTEKSAGLWGLAVVLLTRTFRILWCWQLKHAAGDIHMREQALWQKGTQLF